MKKILHWLKMVYFTMMFLSAALAFAAATYAWFTANEQVETSRITAETGKQDLELQISRSNFNPAPNQEVELKAPANLLMPVQERQLALQLGFSGRRNDIDSTRPTASSR